MDAAGQRAPARPGLAARWRLCPSEPGAPRPGADAPWRDIDGPQTVACALRSRGEWSLDGPPRDFDAQDWWYLATFDAPAPSADRRLKFGGLATGCEAFLNGAALFTSEHMFTAHVAELPGLRPEGNELVLRFPSLTARLAQRRPRPRWRTPMVAHQQLRWHRTTLLGRTPGWSPPAAPVGPWRDVAWADGLAESLAGRLHARVEDGAGVVELDLTGAPGWTASIERAELSVRGHGQALRTDLQPGRTSLRVPGVRLWWPHTHGEPALYEVELQMVLRDGTPRSLALGRVGFRDVRVDTGPGRFQVLVNGVPVFCRGAGWTPLDPVSLRSAPQACRQALLQCRDAGFNMLRVAGTLVYEEDHFYALCDELGVLVWQDLMFASMDYPFDDAGFAAAAAAEVRQQLQRLHAHACLAVLCGNSEVEQQAAMWGAPRELWQPRFFHETVPALCRELAPRLAYWPSSAHGGAFPHQASEGTTSYYGVGAYERPLDDARRSALAFATECLAFANVPPASTLARLPGGLATRVHHPAWKARSPRDLGAGWDFDDVRDHYVQRLFDVDPQRLRHADHDRYLALGRLATAEAMQAAFAEWRRPGSGCGGALLLFLRDLWAGAGWGVVDDLGRPKSGWHALRRALQPLSVALTDEGGNGLDVHLVNEHGQDRDVVLDVEAWRDGHVRVAQGRLAATLPARGARTVSACEVLGRFLDLNHAYRFGPPACEAVAATLRDTDGDVFARALHFPLGLGALLAQRRELGLRAAVRLQGDDAQVELEAGSLALGVHFDLPGWTAADEHFHLLPGERRVVALRRDGGAAPLAGTVAALNGLHPTDLEASP